MVKYIILILLDILFLTLNAHADENNFIKMAYYENFHPFSIKSNGMVKGIFVDYIEYIFTKSNDYKIISDAFPWERAQDFVRKDKYDAHFTLKNSKREAYLLAGNTPVFEDELVIVYSVTNNKIKEIEKIDSLDKFREFQINDYIGNSRISSYSEEKGFHLNLFSNIEDAYEKLFINKGDVIISSKIIADIEIKQNYEKALKYKKIDFIFDNKLTYYFMVRKSRKDAEKIVNIFEKNIKLDKNKLKLKELYKKYVEEYKY